MPSGRSERDGDGWRGLLLRWCGLRLRRRADADSREKPFWRFFDRQAFIIMAIMMTVGISLRAFSLVPGWFIAFFYTGLGIALTGAGIGFLLELARMLREGRSLHRGT